MKLPPDWREFIELLNSTGVDYVVVGGHAVGYHGYPRYTGDIDFLVRADAENAARVVSALVAFGFDGGTELEKSLRTAGSVIQLGRPPNRIDLLTSISGVTFDEAAAGAEAASLDGLPVPILGRVALLKNKRASGRTKDLADAEEVERLRGSDETE
jgi:hypothetical protein